VLLSDSVVGLVQRKIEVATEMKLGDCCFNRSARILDIQATAICPFIDNYIL